MRNKSLIHTKDVKTQEGTPLHLEYYLLNDSLLDGCAECYGVEILAQTGEAQCYAGIPRITGGTGELLARIDAEGDAAADLHAHRPARLLCRHAGLAAGCPAGLALTAARRRLQNR